MTNTTTYKYSCFNCPDISNKDSDRFYSSEKHPITHVFHCVMYKTAVVFDLILMLYMGYQVYIYLIWVQVVVTDLRMLIWTLCIIYQFICFVEYGFIDFKFSITGLVIQDLFRNSIFALICIWYVLQSRKVLKYDRKFWNCL